MKIVPQPAFGSAYPDGIFGVLIARGCVNRLQTLSIAADKRAVEGRLRDEKPKDPIWVGRAKRWGRHDLHTLAPCSLILKSIVPSDPPLVTAPLCRGG